jgi:4-hydroxybenzoate polyprenyltransferase
MIAWIIFIAIWLILFAFKKYEDTEPDTNPFTMDEDQEDRKKIWRVVFFTLGVIALLTLLVVALIFATWLTPIYLIVGTYIVSLMWHLRDKPLETAKLHAKSCVGIAIIGAIVFGGLIGIILLVFNGHR